MRCLIVDDNPRFLEAARGLLEREGAVVVGVASTGAEAIERIQELSPDVTLLDIDLGGREWLRGRAATAPAGRLSSDPDLDICRGGLRGPIAGSPALGFLAKSALSASAVRDLLESRGGRHGTVTEPPGM
jgi:hypothetical protein